VFPPSAPGRTSPGPGPAQQGAFHRLRTSSTRSTVLVGFWKTLRDNRSAVRDVEWLRENKLTSQETHERFAAESLTRLDRDVAAPGPRAYGAPADPGDGRGGVRAEILVSLFLDVGLDADHSTAPSQASCASTA